VKRHKASGTIHEYRFCKILFPLEITLPCAIISEIFSRLTRHNFFSKVRFLQVIKIIYGFSVLFVSLILTACAPTVPAVKGKVVPTQKDSNSISQLVKSDVDRMADLEMRENTQSLKTLMTKLYKRNPVELKKSTSDSVEKMVDWVFEGDHGWNFEMLDNLRDLDAMYLAFKPEYSGDRVLAFVVGIQTMLIKARGNKTEFYLTDSVDPQSVYNTARNIEIAAWKLSNTRDENGNLYFLTNEMQPGKDQNLSFEREIGKMIGRTDLYAEILAEKSQRGLTNFTQGFATKVFLPITFPFVR